MWCIILLCQLLPTTINTGLTQLILRDSCGNDFLPSIWVFIFFTLFSQLDRSIALHGWRRDTCYKHAVFILNLLMHITWLIAHTEGALIGCLPSSNSG